MKVAFCSSEAVPFEKTGGLADVCGTLPLELAKLGLEVIMIMPRYKNISQKEFNVVRVNDEFSKTSLNGNVDVYFIEHEDYFHRNGLYGDEHGDFGDNLDRFKYFSIQSLNLLKQLDWKADIVHCHDWHAALIPVYLKDMFNKDPFFERMKSVLTIHNLAYQGIFSIDQFERLDLSYDLLNEDGFLFYENISFLKAGIIYSDEVTTVSPQYATDIQTRAFGCGLDQVLQTHKGGVIGILNGLDYDYWNPETDSYIKCNYATDNYLEGKLNNKMELQKELGLAVDIDMPLFGFVGRLTHQKGIDLIIHALDELKDENFQVIIQGMGDKHYQNELIRISKEAHNHLSMVFEYNERVAHMIYAGSDWFLMPSQFEPCGLAQMISMRYGTPPIVYRTGGLADTVDPYKAEISSGNGLVFQENNVNAFVDSIHEALNLFQDKGAHLKMVANAMDTRFTWKESAQKYKELYQWLQSD